ncbi:MAG: hypothetical protein ACQGVC_14490 [Myxococcota bacterium]
MIPRAKRLATALLLLGTVALAGAGCAGAKPSRSLYQWTDGDGNVRYTAFPDRIPAAREHTRRIVEPGASAAQNASVQRDAPPEPVALPAAGLDARIAELEAQVAEDEEALKVLISDPKMAETLRGSPEMREIGSRLPGRQAELERLRAERTKREAPDSPAPSQATDGAGDDG